MKKLFKKMVQQKVTEVRQELARAHLIIALLSVAVIMLIVQGITQPVLLDLTLSTISIILLGVVTLTSLSMSFALFTNKNKK